jgi:hypothetical protein
VKVTPANQSLILAGEPGPGARPNSLLGQASQLVASGAALKRVTILTARPGTTVVVQADYFARNDVQPANSQLTVEHIAPTETPNLQIATSSNRSPIELYSRTQRGPEDTRKATLLDVFA